MYLESIDSITNDKDSASIFGIKVSFEASMDFSLVHSMFFINDSQYWETNHPKEGNVMIYVGCTCKNPSIYNYGSRIHKMIRFMFLAFLHL